MVIHLVMGSLGDVDVGVRGRWRQSSSLSRIRLVSVILDSGLVSVVIEKKDVLNV